MKKETLEQMDEKRYTSPTVKSVPLVMTGLLCTSERTMMLNTTEMGEGDENW